MASGSNSNSHSFGTSSRDGAFYIWQRYGVTGFEGWTSGEFLGRGCFGTVTKAIDGQGNAVAACKAVNANGHYGTLQEVRSMEKLEHVNVVKLLVFKSDMGTKDSLLYLELCSEGDGLGLMAKFGTEGMGQRLANRFLAQLIDGVAYLHSKNVCHRDLKLENLFFASNDVLKIGDFNLSLPFYDVKARAEIRSTHAAGTVYTMAPELFRREDLQAGVRRPTTDIFSVGIIYTMFMTNRKPWDQATALVWDWEYISWRNENNRIVARQAPFESLNMSSAYWGALSPYMYSFVHWLLADDPMKRIVNGVQAKQTRFYKMIRQESADDDVFEYSTQRTDKFIDVRNKINHSPMTKLAVTGRRMSSSALQPGRVRAKRVQSVSEISLSNFSLIKSALSPLETAQLLNLAMTKKGYRFDRIGKTGFLVKKAPVNKVDQLTRVDVLLDENNKSTISVQMVSGTADRELNDFLTSCLTPSRVSV